MKLILEPILILCLMVLLYGLNLISTIIVSVALFVWNFKIPDVKKIFNTLNSAYIKNDDKEQYDLSDGQKSNLSVIQGIVLAIIIVVTLT